MSPEAQLLSVIIADSVEESHVKRFEGPFSDFSNILPLTERFELSENLLREAFDFFVFLGFGSKSEGKVLPDWIKFDRPDRRKLFDRYNSIFSNDDVWSNLNDEIYNANLKDYSELIEFKNAFRFDPTYSEKALTILLKPNSITNLNAYMDAQGVVKNIPASDRTVTFGDNSGIIIQTAENLTININSQNEWKTTEEKEIAQSGMSFLQKIISSKSFKYTLIAAGVAFLAWLKSTFPEHAIGEMAEQLIVLLQAVVAK